MLPNLGNRRKLTIAMVVFAVLIVLSMVPALSLLVVWLLPIPLITAHVLTNRYTSMGLSAFAGLMLIVTGYGWTALLFALGLYFVTWVIGEGIARTESPYYPLLFGTLTFLMMELVLLAMIRWTGVDIYATLTHQITVSINQNEHLFGLSGTTVQSLTAEASDWIKLMLPAVLCVLSFVLATINYAVSVRILGTDAGPVRPLLLSYKLPYWVALVYILALMMAWLSFFKNTPFLWQTVNDAIFVCGFFLGIQGIALIWRQLHNRRLHTLYLIILIVLPGIIRIIGDIYVLIGLFDLSRMTRRRT